MKKEKIYLQYGFWRAAKKLDMDIFGPNAWDLFDVLQSSNVRAEIPIENFGQDDFLSILWHKSNGSCFAEKGQIDEVLKEDNFSIDIHKL